MNINVTLPEMFLTKMLAIAERIAWAAEKIAGPDIRMEMPKPFDPSLWMESSNAQSRQIEEEERREALGTGPSHWADLEASAAQRPSAGSNHGAGEPEGSSVP